MPDVTASIERAPRTARKTSFFDAEPIAWWLSVVLVVYAIFSLGDDLNNLFGTLDAAAPREILLAIDSILAYAVVGLVAWRATWASVALISCFMTSLMLGEFVVAMLATAVVTLAVLATATRRFIAAHLTGCTVWILVAVLIWHGTNGLLFWTLLPFVAVPALAGAAIRHFQGQRRRNEQHVRDLELLNRRLREDERMALARDLHDVVAHELTLITMQTMSRRRSDDLDQLHGVLETVEGAARSALHELRVLLQLLRNENEDEHPRDVTGAGLSIGSLEHVVTSLTASLEDLGFEPDVVLTGDLDAMPTTARGTAARILQEAVTNIIKYAPSGSRCRIEVTGDSRELRMCVSNSLPHTRPAGAAISELSSGLGLRGIAERVSLLGGRSESGPEDGHWVLRVSLPVDRRESV